VAISAVTLAELSAGPHQVRPNHEQEMYDEHEERARRTEALQRAESEFDPVPFDAEAAPIYGRVTAACAAGRQPRRRIADLMIAATTGRPTTVIHGHTGQRGASPDLRFRCSADPYPEPSKLVMRVRFPSSALTDY
jgi:predicted nucleic acid-binding protein